MSVAPLRGCPANKLIGAEIQIPPQHFPVLVARDKRHLGDVEAGLKKAAGSLMAQVVETQVDDTECATGPTERGPE